MRTSTRLALISVALVAAFAHGYAQGATDLPMVCTDPSAAGKPVNQACGGREQTGQVYKTPGATDLVRINPGQTAADWDSPRYIWAAWKDLSPGDWYDRCTTDVAEGAAVPAINCTAWAMKQKAGPRAPTFIVSPSSGRAPLTVTIGWDVDQGDQCQAGGAWTGARASSGSTTATLQVGSATFTLTCSRPTGPAGPSSALLSWTPPTQNTDGTALTDLAGYQIYQGTTSPPQVKLSMTAPGTAQRTIGQLAANTIVYWSLAAVNAAGTEGLMSGIASKWMPNTPTAQPWTGTQSVTVTAAPAPARPKAPILTVE